MAPWPSVDHGAVSPRQAAEDGPVRVVSEQLMPALNAKALRCREVSFWQGAHRGVNGRQSNWTTNRADLQISCSDIRGRNNVARAHHVDPKVVTRCRETTSSAILQSYLGGLQELRDIWDESAWDTLLSRERIVLGWEDGSIQGERQPQSWAPTRMHYAQGVVAICFRNHIYAT